MIQTKKHSTNQKNNDLFPVATESRSKTDACVELSGTPAARIPMTSGAGPELPQLAQRSDLCLRDGEDAILCGARVGRRSGVCPMAAFFGERSRLLSTKFCASLWQTESFLNETRPDNGAPQRTNVKTEITGHGGFSQYLFRFKLKNSPYCACDPAKIQDVLHVFEECDMFLRGRKALETEIGVRIERNHSPEILENTGKR
ncbi:Retrovirus-related Pol polyprotein from type-1 retrotransposable element R1 3, partial [Eumeta japonica]